MSHIVRVATNIRDLEALKVALTEIGLTLEIGECKVADYFDKQEPCQGRVRIGDYFVGFQSTESGTYKMAGDFWGVYRSKNIPAVLRGEMGSIAMLEQGNSNLSVRGAQDIGSRALLKVIGQNYGVAATRRFAAQTGYRVVQEQEGDMVRLRLRRY